MPASTSPVLPRPPICTCKDGFEDNKVLSLHCPPSEWMKLRELGPLFTAFYRELVNKQGTIRQKIKKKKIINWKMMLCLTISDPTVMSQQTSVSNCFYYMLTIALSVQQIIWCKYLRIFNLNHCSVHLWTILLANQRSGRLLQSL